MLTLTQCIKRFTNPDGTQNIVINVPSYSLAAGEHAALRGTSGSGKTTLLHLIAGILKADEGQISIDGNEMTGQSEARRDEIRSRTIGYVFQTFNLLQGYTALENVELAMMVGTGVDHAYATHLLERVGLSDRMNHYPRQLSVGQQQRVAVARALANHPRLVLADEPTGNLDPHHTDAALHLIRDICREENASLLLVTHEEKVITQFERVDDLSQINQAVHKGEAS